MFLAALLAVLPAGVQGPKDEDNTPKGWVGCRRPGMVAASLRTSFALIQRERHRHEYREGLQPP